MSQYIGGTLSVSTAAPATDDETGFEALTYTEVGRVTNIGMLGDVHEPLSETYLKSGRTDREKGAADGGETEVTCTGDRTDAGQVLIEAGANGAQSDTEHTFRLTLKNGKSKYWKALIANLRERDVSANSRQGFTFTMFINSQIFGPYSA